MAGLLAPYIPDSSEWFKSRAQGYALGDTMRNRDLRVDAGGQAAEGDMAGAKSTLYEGGDFEGGNQINQMMRQASDDALKKTERFHSTLGNLALAADTPEKWTAAVTAAKSAGLDVSKYGDFGSRQTLLAQSGKTIEALKMEMERRKIEQGGRETFGVAPAYALDEQGNSVPVQFSSKGRAKTPDLAPGLSFQTAEQKKASEARGKAIGKDQGEAAQAIPMAETAADAAIGVINKLRTHPGRKQATGFTSFTAVVPGTEAYNFKVLNDQAKAKTFMEARAALKGAGQVTDFEGNKGEAAIARLDRAQTEEEYMAALDDLEVMINKSLADLKKKAGTPKDASRIEATPGARTSPSYSANVPPEALQMLRGNPTPQTMQQFDEVFGEGAAAKALGR